MPGVRTHACAALTCSAHMALSCVPCRVLLMVASTCSDRARTGTLAQVSRARVQVSHSCCVLHAGALQPSPLDDLAFSKKPRAVEFQPYSMVSTHGDDVYAWPTRHRWSCQQGQHSGAGQPKATASTAPAAVATGGACSVHILLYATLLCDAQESLIYASDMVLVTKGTPC